MVIMVIEISDFLSRVEASQYTIFTQKFHSSVTKTLKKFGGHIQRQDNNHYIVSFVSVTDAVQCTLEIRHKFKYVTPKHKSFSRRLKIALSYADQLNEVQINATIQLCEQIKDQVVITNDIKRMYEEVNAHAEIDKDQIRTLKLSEEQFLSNLMNYVASNWNNPYLDVDRLGEALQMTYSQLHHRITRLTGKTPNNFIKDYRLHKALVLLHQHRGSIAQISKQSGFNSPTYFSECFLNKYGVRPSTYAQQHGL